MQFGQPKEYFQTFKNQNNAMQQNTTLLNPFSHSLGKNPFFEIAAEPVFIDGDYKIYKLYEKHYVHTFKNIVIAERCAINKGLLKALKDNIKPVVESAIYHDFERPLWAKNEGLRIAKNLKFTIN